MKKLILTWCQFTTIWRSSRRSLNQTKILICRNLSVNGQKQTRLKYSSLTMLEDARSLNVSSSLMKLRTSPHTRSRQSLLVQVKELRLSWLVTSHRLIHHTRMNEAMDSPTSSTNGKENQNSSTFTWFMENVAIWQTKLVESCNNPEQIKTPGCFNQGIFY